jgi:hypothetical protein
MILQCIQYQYKLKLWGLSSIFKKLKLIPNELFFSSNYKYMLLILLLLLSFMDEKDLNSCQLNWINCAVIYQLSQFLWTNFELFLTFRFNWISFYLTSHLLWYGIYQTSVGRVHSDNLYSLICVHFIWWSKGLRLRNIYSYNFVNRF